MIQSLEITNFRGFTQVKLDNLTSINVLVGDNGSGKTSLLEALFLTGGLGPEIYLRLRAWRGAGEQLSLTLDRDNYEALWKEIFHDLDQDKPVIIQFKDSDSGMRSLRIYYGDDDASIFRTVDVRTPSSFESTSIRPITFEWRTDNGETYKMSVKVTADGINLPQFYGSYPIIFIAGTTAFNPADNAKRFSSLSRKKAQGTVIEAVRRLFPIVEDLTVELVSGTTGIYASVNGLGEKLPIGSLSAGLTKYIAILIAIASQPGGVVIVDEIENGFYFEKYKQLWAGVTDLCHENRTQLFASTHSLECLKAALPVVKAKPSRFCVLRTERHGSSFDVKKFSGKDFVAALEQDIDFR